MAKRIAVVRLMRKAMIEIGIAGANPSVNEPEQP